MQSTSPEEDNVALMTSTKFSSTFLHGMAHGMLSFPYCHCLLPAFFNNFQYSSLGTHLGRLNGVKTLCVRVCVQCSHIASTKSSSSGRHIPRWRLGNHKNVCHIIVMANG